MKRIKPSITKIFLIFLIIFYSTFWFYLAEKTSIEFDETTHSLLAIFYKDLIKYSISHLNFKEIYDYAYSYLVYYPKLSVYYPPLIHLTIAFVFSFFNPSFLLARCVIIFFSVLFILLIFKFSKFILKNEKTALLTAILFCSSPMTIYLSRGVYLDLPLAFFFTLAIFLYLVALETNKKKYYFFASLISTLGFLVKWFFILALPIIFFYTLLEHKRKLKFLLISFILFSFLISPYVFLLLKMDLISFQYKSAIPLGTGGMPGVTDFFNWVFYPYVINKHYFVFPLSLILLFSVYKYWRNKKPYWKLMLVWIVFLYLFLSLFPNKDSKYFFIAIAPFCIITADFLSEHIKKILSFILIGTLLIINSLVSFNIIPFHKLESLYGKPSYALQFYKTYGKEISDFIISNPYPTYFASETSRALPSETMFYLASQGKFIKILRPCAGDFDINKTLYETGVKWVIYDTKDKNNSYILKLKEKNLVTLERNIDEIEIYRYNFFNPNLKENCNIVCLIEEKVCEKVKLS
ncbi:MAG: glycosyltransferase family 39 protein [Candidatus Aenigmatarchaeota archaeon]